MTHTTTRKILMGLCAAPTIFACLALTAGAQTTTSERIPGATKSATTKLSGIVKYVEGNSLVASMSSGELRTFTVPDSQKFVIDGKEVTVHDLKPGTSLSATVVVSTTPVTERTVTRLTGTVWYVQGNTVILTLPDGKNKMYKSQPHYKFTVNGEDAEVSSLRKGMIISAEKIVEEPMTEVARNTTVVGKAPKPKAVVAQSRASAPAPAAAPAPEPVQVAAASEPAPNPAPEPPSAESAQALPNKLPTTGSDLPLAGMLGLLLVGAGLGLRMLRLRLS